MPVIHDTAFESVPPSPQNQDRGFIDFARNAFGIFDGMKGGANGGDAAELTKRYIEEAIQRLPPVSSQSKAETTVKMLLSDATAALSTYAREHKCTMGTTASICLLVPGTNSDAIAVVGNVGDSRVYTMNPSGELHQMTIDDSYVRLWYPEEQEARAMQAKLNNATAWEGLSQKEVRCFSERHLMTQVLGDAEIEPRIHTVSVGHGWSILLTTDGVHDNLTDKEMEVIVRATSTAHNAVHALISAAAKRSHEPGIRSNFDDMTALMIRL